MSAFAVPVNAPDAATVLMAIQNSLNTLPGISNVLRDAAKVYVAGMARLAQPGVVLSAAPPADEVAHYDELEMGVMNILEANNENDKYANRFKRPTGSYSAKVGNLLFYPPSSSKDSTRDTLVHGPDTTHRMLAAHLSEKGLYTMDLYPFSTELPRKSATFKAFAWDESFAEEDTAQKLWDLLVPDAQSVYVQRAVEVGLEIVWGKPVKEAYAKAVSTLGHGWAWLTSTADIAVPGITNTHGTFTAGTQSVSFQLAYHSALGSIKFGKLVSFHCHPCKSGALKAKGYNCTPEGWKEANVTDALIRLLYLASIGTTSPAVAPADTFSFIAQPYPAWKDTGRAVISLPSLRAQEIAAGSSFTRQHLDSIDINIMILIDRFYDIDEHSGQSILWQATSQSSKRGSLTKGFEGMSEAGKKAAEKRGFEAMSEDAKRRAQAMGFEAMSQAAKKAKQTQGKDGLQAMGEVVREGRRKSSRKSLVPILAPHDADKQAWLDYVDRHRQKVRQDTKTLPAAQKAKQNLLAKLLPSLFHAGVSESKHRSSESFENWPKDLGFSFCKMNADEMDFIGAMMLANKLKVREDLKASAVPLASSSS